MPPIQVFKFSFKVYRTTFQTFQNINYRKLKLKLEEDKGRGAVIINRDK